MTITIDTRNLPAEERLDYVRSRALQLPEPVDVDGPSPAGFTSVCDFDDVGGVFVGSLCTAGLVRWRIQRNPRLIRRSDPETYVLLVSLRATSGVEQFGQQGVLRPGLMALYDTSFPMRGWRQASEDDAHLAMIAFPKTSLRLNASHRNDLMGRPLNAPSPLGQPLRVTAATAAHAAKAYTPQESATVAEVLTRLLAGLIADPPAKRHPGLASSYVTSFCSGSRPTSTPISVSRPCRRSRSRRPTMSACVPCTGSSTAKAESAAGSGCSASKSAAGN